jgi:hypothetical protein
MRTQANFAAPCDARETIFSGEQHPFTITVH